MNAEKIDGRVIQEDFVDIMREYHTGNRANAIERADACLDRFVWSVINSRYDSYGTHREDLHSEGRLGWISAMDGYDPTVSAPTTYFYHYIIHAIQTYIENNVMHMTTYYNNTSKALKKIISELDAAGIVYDDCLLAERAKLPLETVKNTRMYMNSSVQVSLEPGIMSQASEMYETPEAKVLREEAEAEIDRMMSDLSPADAEIFSCLNGLNGEKRTSKEIAMGLSSLSKESREKYGVSSQLTDTPSDDEKVMQYKVLLGDYCGNGSEITSIFNDCVNKSSTASAKTVKAINAQFKAVLCDYCSGEAYDRLCAILTSEKLIRQRMVPITKTMVNAINKRVVRQLRGKQNIIERDISASCDMDMFSMDDIHEEMDYMEQIPVEELML